MSPSGAGKVFACRRRDSDHSLFHRSRFPVIFLCLANFSFSFETVSNPLEPYMLLTEDSSVSHKGRRACLASFNFQSISAASMPEPTLQEPLKSEDDVQQSRSTLSSTREESLHQASLMAGTRVLGPSDAPCLVKSPTAHGDLLLWTMSSSIGVINLSGLSSYESTVKSKTRLPYILRSKASRTFAILVDRCLCRIPLKSTLTSSCSLMDWSYVLTSEAVMTLTTEGSTRSQPSFPAIVSCPYIHGGASHSSSKGETLGFCILGPFHYRGPLISFWPNVIKSSPSTNLSKPRCVYFIYCPSPFTCFVLHDLSSRRLWLCPEVTNRLWLCTCFPQTLLPTSLKVFPEASPCIWSSTSLPAIIFRIYTVKHLETDCIQQPQLEIVISLFLLQPSRTMVNYSRKNFGLLFRTPLLPVTEKNRTRSSPASQCIKPVIREANYPSSTSQDLLIVTISKIHEPFVEVSSTHRVLACGMLLVSLCFRVYMNLSLKFIVYPISLMYVWKTLLQNFVFVASPLG